MQNSMGYKTLQFVKREQSSKTGKNAKRIDEIVQMTMQLRICFEFFFQIKIRWRSRGNT